MKKTLATTLLILFSLSLFSQSKKNSPDLQVGVLCAVRGLRFLKNL